MRKWKEIASSRYALLAMTRGLTPA
jgi:hypothetical protein